MNSALDMTALINRPPGQRALFQLVIPRTPPEQRRGAHRGLPNGFGTQDCPHCLFRSRNPHLPGRQRLDVGSRNTLQGSGERSAAARGNHNEPAKIGIDYLDYDHRAARRIQDNWGFKPDNVYALDSREQNSNVPRCMRPVVFD